MKVQVNRKDFIEVDNILKLELRKGEVFVHLKEGYPKILRTRGTLGNFIKRLVNVGVNSKRVLELKTVK